MGLIRDVAQHSRTGLRRPDGARIGEVTARERLLSEAPGWTDAQVTAALSVVAAHDALASYLENESELSAGDLDARDTHWSEASAREAIREEPW